MDELMGSLSRYDRSMAIYLIPDGKEVDVMRNDGKEMIQTAC